MDELFPNWAAEGAPSTPVTDDEVYYLPDGDHKVKVPGFFVPKATHNEGNHAISLGNLCRWLGEQAENLGVNVFPGFAASEILYNDDGAVVGVATEISAWAGMVNPRVPSPRAMSFARSTRFSQKAAADIWASSSLKSLNSTKTQVPSTTASASRSFGTSRRNSTCLERSCTAWLALAETSRNTGGSFLPS